MTADKTLLQMKYARIISLLSKKMKGDNIMAKTKTSIRGKQNKKIVHVRGYKRADGTKVGAHRRSTPN